MDGVARWMLARRVIVLVVITIVTLLSLKPFVGLGEGGVYNLFDFRPERVFASEDETFKFLEHHQAMFGRGDMNAVILVSGDGALSADALSQTRAWTERFRSIEGITRVESLSTAKVIRRRPPSTSDTFRLPFESPNPLLPFKIEHDEEAAALVREAREHPFLSTMIGKETDAQAFLLWIDPNLERTYEYSPVIESIKDTAQGLNVPEGTRVDVAGLPVLRPALLDRMFDDQQRSVAISSILFVIILAVMFRDWKAVVLPLFAVNLATLWTLGALFGTGGKLDVINNVIVTLIFVIAIADGIHLLERYRHETAQGAPVREALRTTLARLATACFFTSLTTAVGFASLVSASNHTLASFGLYAAIGVLCAYGAVITVLPLALSFFKPLRPAKTEGRMTRLAQWMLDTCERLTWSHPKILFVTGVVTVIIAGILTLGLRVENNLMEGFREDDPVAQAQARISETIGGVLPYDVHLSWDENFNPCRVDYLEAIDQIQAELVAQPGIDYAFSRTDLLRECSMASAIGERVLPPSDLAVCFSMMLLGLAGERGPLHDLFRTEVRSERIVARLHDVGGQNAMRVTAELEESIAEILAPFPEVDVRITGDGPVGYAGLQTLLSDLWRSLFLAFIFIFFVMFVLLRSWRASLLAMLPNVIPVLFAAAWIKITGGELRASAVIVFAIGLGLAVDDTIHFTVRFREEFKRDRNYRQALRRTYAGAGAAILATTLLLGVGFSVLLWSSFPVAVSFGQLLELTLLAAVFGDLLVLPACLVLFKPFGPEAVTSEAHGETG